MPVADTTRIPAHADAPSRPSTLYTLAPAAKTTIDARCDVRRSTIDARSLAPPLPRSYSIASDRGFRVSSPGGGERYYPARAAIVTMTDGSRTAYALQEVRRRGSSETLAWLDWIVRCLLYGAWGRVQGTGAARVLFWWSVAGRGGRTRRCCCRDQRGREPTRSRAGRDCGMLSIQIPRMRSSIRVPVGVRLRLRLRRPKQVFAAGEIVGV
ncbi:hypothetical protein C8J57DRAFT_158890 [Mycena rebaudengoi]|nr:hypothetical protein C8J57DRAFT_158890 [Mycena rebaudengoi]